MYTNPKIAAMEIANKFVTKSIFDMSDDELKQERVNAISNANICVDEIQRFIEYIYSHYGISLDNFDWPEIKNELNKLKE